MHRNLIKSDLTFKYLALTANRPENQTSFTYPKLNMDDFSALYGAFVYVDSTKKV